MSILYQRYPIARFDKARLAHVIGCSDSGDGGGSNWQAEWSWLLASASLSQSSSDVIMEGWCYFPCETDGNMRPKLAIFRLAQMVPPIECDLGYRFRTRTLNPNPNPKSNKNLCSAKRHPNKFQKSVINTSYFVGQG